VAEDEAGEPPGLPLPTPRDMTTLRRFLVLQALVLWQGGFLFYAAVVVPVGTAFLGSAAAQGAITARVTDVMNVIGSVALLLLAWELNHGRDPDRTRDLIRWVCWTVAFLTHALLFYLHWWLDGLMDPGRTHAVNRPLFYHVHRVYLITITVQWLACLILAWFMLRGWRSEDVWR
jgi:hypothetical protein